MVPGFSLNAVIYFEKKSGKKNSYTMKDFYLQFKEPGAILGLPSSFALPAANKA